MRKLKIVIFFTSIVIFGCVNKSATEQNGSKEQIENELVPTKKKENSLSEIFREIKSLILKNARYNGEYPGKINENISEKIFHVIYEVSDSEININEKIDLLHLMIQFQSYTPRVYRNKIFHLMEKKDSLVISKSLFALPILFCHYCESTEILSLLQNISIKFPDGMDSVHTKYYKELLQRIEKLDSSTDFNRKLTWKIKNFKEYKEFISNLKKDYPEFKWDTKVSW